MKHISKSNENIIPVKVGVIGIVGVSDLNEERGNLAMTQFNCNWYRNYKDLLNQVEAVCIAVPTLFHYEVGLDCLNSGKHVKKITTSWSY